MNSSRRMMIVAMALGLLLVLVTSLGYRMGGAPLVKQTGRPAASTPAASEAMSAMPENMPPAMAEALAKLEAEKGTDQPAAMQGMMENMPPAMAEALAKGEMGQGANQGADQGAAMRAMMEKMGGAQGDPRQNAIVERMQRLQGNPNDVDALLDLADVFMDENPQSAQGFLNRAAVAAPSDPRPSYYMGVLSTRQGNFAEAESAMLRSLSMQDNPSTRYSLAIIYAYHMNKAEESKEQLKAALQSPDITPELRTLVEEELAK